MKYLKYILLLFLYSPVFCINFSDIKYLRNQYTQQQDLYVDKVSSSSYSLNSNLLNGTSEYSRTLFDAVIPDNYPDINTAMDAGKYNLFIKDGLYKLTESILLPQNECIKLIGDCNQVSIDTQGFSFLIGEWNQINTHHALGYIADKGDGTPVIRLYSSSDSWNFSQLDPSKKYHACLYPNFGDNIVKVKIDDYQTIEPTDYNPFIIDPTILKIYIYCDSNIDTNGAAGTVTSGINVVTVDTNSFLSGGLSDIGLTNTDTYYFSINDTRRNPHIQIDHIDYGNNLIYLKNIWSGLSATGSIYFFKENFNPQFSNLEFYSSGVNSPSYIFYPISCTNSGVDRIMGATIKLQLDNIRTRIFNNNYMTFSYDNFGYRHLFNNCETNAEFYLPYDSVVSNTLMYGGNYDYGWTTYANNVIYDHNQVGSFSSYIGNQFVGIDPGIDADPTCMGIGNIDSTNQIMIKDQETNHLHCQNDVHFPNTNTGVVLTDRNLVDKRRYFVRDGRPGVEDENGNQSWFAPPNQTFYEINASTGGVIIDLPNPQTIPLDVYTIKKVDISTNTVVIYNPHPIVSSITFNGTGLNDFYTTGNSTSVVDRSFYLEIDGNVSVSSTTYTGNVGDIDKNQVIQGDWTLNETTVLLKCVDNTGFDLMQTSIDNGATWSSSFLIPDDGNIHFGGTPLYIHLLSKVGHTVNDTWSAHVIPDSFKYSHDGGATFEVSKVGIGEALNIEGFTSHFTYTSGHTIGDNWSFNVITGKIDDEIKYTLNTYNQSVVLIASGTHYSVSSVNPFWVNNSSYSLNSSQLGNHTSDYYLNISSETQSKLGQITFSTVTINGDIYVNNNILINEVTDPVNVPVNAIDLHSVDQNGFSVLHLEDNTGYHPEVCRDNFDIGRNTTSSIIYKGQAVYYTGATGNVPNIGLAESTNLTKSYAVGFALENIAINAFGRYLKSGILENIDTSMWVEGTTLYLGTFTVVGSQLNLTSVEPVLPNIIRRMGIVKQSGVGNGSIDISIGSTHNRDRGSIYDFGVPNLTATYGISSSTGVFSSSVTFNNNSIIYKDSNTLQFNLYNTAMKTGGSMALSFNGATKDYVSIPYISTYSFAGAFSVEAWVKIDASQLANNNMVVSERNVAGTDGFQLDYSGGNFRWIIVHSGTVLVNSDATTSTNWTHLVGKRDASGNMKMYVNGTLQTGSATKSGTISQDSPIYLGAYKATQYNHTGLIDEVRVWNYDLSDSSVTYLYNSGAGRYSVDTSKLLGGWHLDEGSGVTVSDYSSFSNNGSITGATWTTGLVNSPGTNLLFTVLTNANGSDANEAGITTLSSKNSSSYGRVVIDGQTDRFNIAGVEKARFDSSGNLGINTTTPVKTLDINGGVNIGNPINEGSGVTINGVLSPSILQVNDLAGTTTTMFLLHKHSKVAAPTIMSARSYSNDSTHVSVASNTSVLDIVGTGVTNNSYTSYNKIAQISFVTSSTNTISGTNSPGDIVFYTTKIGTTTPTEKMRIRQDGNLIFVSSGGFPCGSMYGDDISIVVPIGAIGTEYSVGSGLTGDVLNQFTFNASTITCLISGRYKIDWSMSIQSTAANQEIEGGMMINSVAVHHCSGAGIAITANKAISVSGHCITTLNAGDILNFYVENDTGTNDITVTHANMVILMVGS